MRPHSFIKWVMEMKKTKKTLLTAAVLTAAVSFTSCEPSGSTVQEVYGPPVVQEDTTYDPAMDTPQTEYEAPIEIEEETTEQTTTKLTTTKATTVKLTTAETTTETTEEPTTEIITMPDVTLYDPSLYTVPAVYGPPADEIEPDTYEPKNDRQAMLYGPLDAT